MRSVFEIANIPSDFQNVLFGIALILIAGFFVSGVDLGLFKIPRIPHGRKYKVLAGGIVLLALLIFSRIPIFGPAPEPPVVAGPFGSQSICTGDWVFRVRDFCDDVSKPHFASISDGAICGYSTESKVVQPEGYKTCRDISHGVERYANSEVVSQNSGRVGGGLSQAWWCQQMKNGYQAARPNTPIVWSDESSGESSDKDWKGHVTYNYSCTATASWNPIYFETANAACGKMDSYTEEVNIPKTCEDKSNIISYEKTRNARCDFAQGNETAANTEILSLIEKNSSRIIEMPKCSTCDELAANADQRAACLIEMFSTIAFGATSEEALKRVSGQIKQVARSLITAKRHISEENEIKLKEILH